jgi:hypothetical protein
VNFHRYQGLAAGHAEYQQRAHPSLPILRRDEVERRLAAEPSAQPILALEREWKKDARPYYRVWPGILRPLLSLRLERVECRHVRLPVRSLSIELPVGRSIAVDPTTAAWWAAREKLLRPPFELATILAIQDADGIHLLINWTGATWLWGLYTLPLAGGSVEEAIPLAGRPMVPDDPQIPHVERAALLDATRLVCMIALLRDDPGLVVPRVLAADQNQWERSHDLSLVERSRRRGNVGWDLGRDLSEAAQNMKRPEAGEATERTVAPHYRHAHPALVWTGKRAAPQPRLVLRRGSFVHGQTIEDVPQGWYGGQEPPPCPFCLRPMRHVSGRWHCEDCAAAGAPLVTGPARAKRTDRHRGAPGRGKIGS